MKNEFVPYDIALAMKELGFSEELCYGFYDEMDNNKPKAGISYGTINRAPLYQQAFRWFREEYKLSGDVFPVSDDPFKQGGSYHACLTDLSGEEWLGDEELGLHRNYEEAQEACLRKLIEIIKENKDEKDTL